MYAYIHKKCQEFLETKYISGFLEVKDWWMGRGMPADGFLLKKTKVCLKLKKKFFWPSHETRGILVHQRETEPITPASEAQSLNQWTTREAPKMFFKNWIVMVVAQTL